MYYHVLQAGLDSTMPNYKTQKKIEKNSKRSSVNVLLMSHVSEVQCIYTLHNATQRFLIANLGFTETVPLEITGCPIFFPKI